MPQVPERFVRISSANDDNEARKPIEIPWAASRGFKGIRFALALSDSPTFNDPDNPDWTYLDATTDYAVANDLKVILQVGGEGPPKAAAGWKALNGGTEWTYNRRPVLGTSNAVVIAVANIVQEAIRRSRQKFIDAGLNPIDYLYIQTGNEPGLGGSGASGVPDPYGTASGDGYWDGPAQVTATNLVCSYLEFFEAMMSRLQFYGLEVMSPCFEAVNLAQELTTYDAQNSSWKSKITIWTTNLYYTLSGLGRGLGPKEAARIAVWGKDGRGKTSSDTDCFLYKINQLRTEFGASARLAVTETGFNPAFSGLTTGGRSLNHYELGLYRIALLDELCSTCEFEIVTLYNASDTTSSDDDKFGVFSSTPDDEASGTTYSSEIAFARRAGVAESELVTPYAGGEYLKGATESLPFDYTQGIIESWSFNETQMPFTGAVNGRVLSTTGTVASATGKFGNAITTSGSATSSYAGDVSAPAGTYFKTPYTPFYASFWLYVGTSTINTSSYPFRLSNGDSYVNVNLVYDGSLKLRAGSDQQVNGAVTVDSGTISTTTWYFVEVAVDLSAGNLYLAVNGAPWSSTTINGLAWRSVGGTDTESLYVAENGVLASGETVRVDDLILRAFIPDDVDRSKMYLGGTGTASTVL